MINYPGYLQCTEIKYKKMLGTVSIYFFRMKTLTHYISEKFYSLSLSYYITRIHLDSNYQASHILPSVFTTHFSAPTAISLKKIPFGSYFLFTSNNLG